MGEFGQVSQMLLDLIEPRQFPVRALNAAGQILDLILDLGQRIRPQRRLIDLAGDAAQRTGEALLELIDPFR